MGKAVAFDLLKQNDTEEVLIADSNEKSLESAKSFLNNKKVISKVFNASDEKEIENLFNSTDSAIGCISYKYNLKFSQIAIKTKTNFCDLGGNDSVVKEQLKLDKEAKEKNISIIPDCGLAPGMVSVLVKWGLESFNWADSVKIRVGGLPIKPTGILKYGRLFAVDGLINEYVEPVRVLRDGEIISIEPLSDIEEIDFPKPLGKLEAFTTSGGASTLLETYKNRLKNLDYKTIRYPGHGNIMRALYELGFFEGENRALTTKIFEDKIPLCTEDTTLVKIIFEGQNKKHELLTIDKAQDGFTSMMRMTAFPISIISYLQSHDLILEKGVQPQEKCIPTMLFIDALKKRNIKIEGLI